MEFKFLFVLCICFAAVVMAMPYESTNIIREKRDVMETMKNAWSDVVKTFNDAGDAVVHVFKPTEKSVINKMADGIKSLTQ